jgi:hypothetical protein
MNIKQLHDVRAVILARANAAEAQIKVAQAELKISSDNTEAVFAKKYWSGRLEEANESFDLIDRLIRNVFGE